MTHERRKEVLAVRIDGSDLSVSLHRKYETIIRKLSMKAYADNISPFSSCVPVEFAIQDVSETSYDL